MHQTHTHRKPLSTYRYGRYIHWAIHKIRVPRYIHFGIWLFGKQKEKENETMRIDPVIYWPMGCTHTHTHTHTHKWLTFIAIFSLPSIEAYFSAILVARIVAKRIITCPTKCGTILWMIVKVASNTKSYWNDSSILCVKCSMFPIDSGNGKFIFHHETIQSGLSRILRQMYSEREWSLDTCGNEIEIEIECVNCVSSTFGSSLWSLGGE